MLALVIITVIIASPLRLVAGENSCGGDGAWQQFDPTGKCFRLVDTNPTSFQGARDICVSLGGDLASVNTFSEHDYLLKTYQDQLTTNGGSFHWIGGLVLSNKKAGSGGPLFMWLDGSFPNNFQAFPPGSPNPTGSNNCMGMEPTTGGKWKEENCELNRNFLCSKLIEDEEEPETAKNAAIITLAVFCSILSLILCFCAMKLTYL